jgi:TonB family protein
VAPPPAPAAAAPPPDEPVDLTGTTLTAEGDGTGWASAVGNGAAMTGPAGAVRARQAAPAARTPRASGAAGEPPLVSVADLGRRPEPPDLDAELARRYPAEARRDGTGGEAEVRARVGPDGAVDRLRVLAATAPAFGDACLRMLAASRWTPPRDRLGAPCATEIRYTCRFEVSR